MTGWNRREIVRSILQLHGMRLFSREIDYDLIEKQVPFSNAAESPAFMEAERAGLQMI